MLSGSVAVLAGTVSTVLFALSTLPMLIKAARTRDLASYSRGNMVLANVGNAVHSIYVFQLPAGPIWVLHSFYLISSALMLFWHLRYARRPARTAVSPIPPAGEPSRVASEREAGSEHRRTWNALEKRSIAATGRWRTSSCGRRMTLAPRTRMALATSAYLTGNFNAAVQALQRGYQARVRDQDPLGAVRFASWLGLCAQRPRRVRSRRRLAIPPKASWRGQPEEVVERGHLLLHEFYRRSGQRKPGRRRRPRSRVVETGRRFGNPT
jgi:uncharacterized protein with PQ loop repeat